MRSSKLRFTVHTVTELAVAYAHEGLIARRRLKSKESTDPVQGLKCMLSKRRMAADCGSKSDRQGPSLVRGADELQEIGVHDDANSHAGSSPRGPTARPEPRFRRRGNSHARSRHWVNHDNLQCGECGPVSGTALQRAGPS